VEECRDKREKREMKGKPYVGTPGMNWLQYLPKQVNIVMKGEITDQKEIRYTGDRNNK